jgi:hypothetical protein
MALSSRSSPPCTAAQGQPGHGKQKGERQGDEPQYLLSGAGLGMGAGVISGKSLAAFPAPMMVVLVTFRSGIGPGMAAWGIVGNRLAAFPGPMSLLVALLRFGEGPGGEASAGGLGHPDGLTDAKRVGLALAVGDTERVGLALGVGTGDTEPVGLALGVGLEDAERVSCGWGRNSCWPRVRGRRGGSRRAGEKPGHIRGELARIYGRSVVLLEHYLAPEAGEGAETLDLVRIGAEGSPHWARVWPPPRSIPVTRGWSCGWPLTGIALSACPSDNHHEHSRICAYANTTR